MSQSKRAYSELLNTELLNTKRKMVRFVFTEKDQRTAHSIIGKKVRRHVSDAERDKFIEKINRNTVINPSPITLGTMYDTAIRASEQERLRFLSSFVSHSNKFTEVVKNLIGSNQVKDTDTELMWSVLPEKLRTECLSIQRSLKNERDDYMALLRLYEFGNKELDELRLVQNKEAASFLQFVDNTNCETDTEWPMEDGELEKAKKLYLSLEK
jgi:hypothetical protein